MEKYPQLTNDQKMLSFLHEQMQRAWEQDETQINLAYYSGERQAGLYVYDGHIDIGEQIGVRSAEAVSMFKRLNSAGYIISDIRLFDNEGITSFRGLTNLGLIEIGELPDPRERLLMGLEAAIQTVQNDPRLTPEEKKRKIDWLEEGKFVVRTFGVEVVKAMLRGDIPLVGG